MSAPSEWATARATRFLAEIAALLDAARAEGRREGIEEAAAWCDGGIGYADLHWSEIAEGLRGLASREGAP